MELKVCFLGAVRRRTFICCRNIQISASSAARDRSRSPTIQTMSLTRSLIPQQHRPILNQLLVRLSLRQGQRSLRRSPAKHIDLLPQDQVFRFQRCSRLEARSQDTENQLEQIGHQDASLRRPLAASTPNRIFGTHRSRPPTRRGAPAFLPRSRGGERARPRRPAVGRELDHAARTLSRKRATSVFSRSDCSDSSLAEFSTCVAAEPTSPDACVTPAIFEDTSLVPAAA